jgi:hypothetical protein
MLNAVKHLLPPAIAHPHSSLCILQKILRFAQDDKVKVLGETNCSELLRNYQTSTNPSFNAFS